MEEHSDNLPVLAEEVPEARVIEPRPAPMALSAPVAAVTGGALVGIATMFLARIVRRALRRQSTLRIGGRRGTKVDIAATRSFLVDVHVLNRR